jgi:hypothetical protein
VTLTWKSSVEPAWSAITALVVQRVARPLPDSLRSQWLTAMMMFITNRLAAEPVSRGSATEISAPTHRKLSVQGG